MLALALVAVFAAGSARAECPTAPGTPYASMDSENWCTSLQINWTPSASGANHYLIYRDGALAGSSSYHGFTDSGLSPNTSYTYRIVAVGPDLDPCQVSGGSATFHTRLAPTGKEFAPVNVQGFCHLITFDWLKSIDGVTTAEVYRREVGSGLDFGMVGGIGVASSHFEDVDLPSNRRYEYRIQGIDYCGQKSGMSDPTEGSTTLAPQQAGTLGEVADACRSISVGWDPVTDVHQYRIWRAQGACGDNPLALVGGAPSDKLRWDDSDLQPATDYSYVLEYQNFCGDNGPKGPCTTMRTRELPQPPAGVSASARLTDVLLGWGAATDATSYTVLRGTDPGCASGLTAIGGGTGLEWADTTAIPGVAYYYRVDSVGDCGTTPGPCVSATRYGPPAISDGSSGRPPMGATRGSIDGSSVTLTWDASCGVRYVRVLYGDRTHLPSAPGQAFTVQTPYCWDDGRTGTMTWGSVPEVLPGQLLWWVLVPVGEDSLEGSWGRDSSGAERVGPGVSGSSGLCSVPGKVANNPTCE